MTEPKRNVVFTGTTGDKNFDVAADTGGSALMQSGETYTVSEKLAERLTASGVWKNAETTAQKSAEKKGVDNG